MTNIFDFNISMALTDDCNSGALESMVKSHVEGAAVIRHHGKELAFSLPMEQVNSFAGKMFLLFYPFYTVCKVRN
jgi:hypothetical protein